MTGRRRILILAILVLAISRNAAGQAWTPPEDHGNQPAGDPLKLPEVAKMPDVLGVRPGMSPQEALQILHQQYPKDLYQEMKVTWWPSVQKPYYGFNILNPVGGQPDVYLSFTAPPSRQVVWRIVRYMNRVNVNHGTLLAALRQKYGKESYAGAENGSPVNDDRTIGQLVWIFDEHGARAPLPALPNGETIFACASINGSPQPIMPRSDDEAHSQFRTECAPYVVLHVAFTPTEIVANTVTELFDGPLALRTAHAADVWQRNGAERARQEAVEKSKQNKPAL